VLEQKIVYSQAIRAYQQAIALEPQVVEPYNNLGNILLSAGAIDQAESIYNKAIAANPNHFGSYLSRQTFWWNEQFDEAVETYIKALHLKPRDPIFFIT